MVIRSVQIPRDLAGNDVNIGRNDGERGVSHPLSVLIPSGADVLWAASSGGHFAQLKRVEDASEAGRGSRWVTFNTPQTAGALAGRSDVTYVDYIAPRKLFDTLRAARQINALTRRTKFDVAISTGSALAAAVLPVARRRGIRAVYVESIARTNGPSLTGKLMALWPGVETFTQYKIWSDEKWKFVGSVLDTWQPANAPIPANVDRNLRIFVTLGTIKPYRFDRLLDAVAAVTTPGDSVSWQTGCTSRTDLRGRVFNQMTPEEFARQVREADVVVTHAGVGTILQILDMGALPVVAPRSKAYGEHIDDHQHLITSELAHRCLSRILDLESPSRATLLEARSSTVTRTEVQ